MVNITLVATFYSVPPILPAAIRFAPKKVILLIEDMSSEIRANIKALERSLGKITEITSVKVSSEDIYKTASKMVEIIDREASKENKVVLTVSGGRRIMSNGALYGCYARADKVYRIVSNTPDHKGLIDLPKLVYNLGTQKMDIMKRIVQGQDKSVTQIADELHRTRGSIYQHLRELKESGYVDEDFHITEAGRLALL